MLISNISLNPEKGLHGSNFINELTIKTF